MIDHLDAQTNDWLENGTRCNAITARSVNEDFDRIMASDDVEESPQRPVISMDDWDKGPVDSIFWGADPIKPLGPEKHRQALPPEHTKRGQAENRLKMIIEADERIKERGQ